MRIGYSFVICLHYYVGMRKKSEPLFVTFFKKNSLAPKIRSGCLVNKSFVLQGNRYPKQLKIAAHLKPISKFMNSTAYSKFRDCDSFYKKRF